MKRPGLQNKQVGVLRMAFRPRKVFGTFEKRGPGHIRFPTYESVFLFFFFFRFRCLYLRMSRTSAIQLETNRKTIRGNATDSGMFDINLGVFKDSQYTRPYGDQSFPIGVMVNERVYLQLSVDSKDSRLAVIAQRCHATSDPNPNSTLQYDLIRNG